MCVSSSVNFKSSPYDRFFESIPNKTVKNTVRLNKTGQMLASPHWNRLAIGVAAFSTQPWLDYYNKDVDRDTATTSACRTIVKIPVCTSVGFAVRGGAYKLVEKFTHGTPEEGSVILTPKAILEETNTELRNSKLKLHKNAFSTVCALAVMLFTNVLIDAPLTAKLSNKLIDYVQNKKKQRQAI